MELLQAWWKEIVAGMSPLVPPQMWEYHIFCQVQPFVVLHWFGATANGVGPMEMDFHFALQSHATMVILNYPCWAMHIELDSMCLVDLPGKVGEYCALRALTCILEDLHAESPGMVLAACAGRQERREMLPELVTLLQREEGRCQLVLQYAIPKCAAKMVGKAIVVPGED